MALVLALASIVFGLSLCQLALALSVLALLTSLILSLLVSAIDVVFRLLHCC